MSYCDAAAWVNYTHANACSPGSPPAYDDYGTNPHTDSCYNYSGYADSGGLPLCSAAFQGSVYVDESACHSNTAFSNVSPHSNVAHQDWTDAHLDWTDAHLDWSNAHADTPTWNNAPHSHGCSGSYNDRSSVYSCTATSWNDYDCAYIVTCTPFINAGAHLYNKFQQGTYGHSQSYVFSSTPHSNQAATHTDNPSSHTDHSYGHTDTHTDWSNWLHTSHKNFCNHQNTNL